MEPTSEEIKKGFKGIVYLYHGNRFHGYPPGHSKYEDSYTVTSGRTGVSRTILYKDLYTKTLDTTKCYLDNGYVVVEMWGDDFLRFERKGGLLLPLLNTSFPK